MGAIFAVTEGGGLVEMTERPYETEAVLQELLAGHPTVLAGDQIDPAAPRRWMLISREMPLASTDAGTGRWSIDHLFLDQDGIPTIVEVKRSTDTRIRREVVGQMIDYAANAVLYWPVDHLRAELEERCRADGLDPGETVVELVGPDGDSDQFWQRVKTNLQAGRVRLIFVGDVIPAELRRSVEFLNQQMDPAEVLAIEIRQYVGKGMKALVPRLLGQTASADRRKTTGPVTPASRVRGADVFEAEISSASPEHQRTLRELCTWARALERDSLARLYSRSGPTYVSLVVWLPSDAAGIVTIYHDRRSGQPSVGVQRSVLDRCAPAVLRRLEPIIGDRSEIRVITPELLDELASAYRLASQPGGMVN